MRSPLAAFAEEEEEARPRRRKRKRRDGVLEIGRPRRKRGDAAALRDLVRPSPPLTKTDPIGAYLAGEMVPCPVGCGGFSEVVHVGTRPNGNGEVWFECLSCAQRQSFEVKKPKPDDIARVLGATDGGGEVYCVRCSRNAMLRRRGRELVCPDCGVRYSPTG